MEPRRSINTSVYIYDAFTRPDVEGGESFKRGYGMFLCWHCRIRAWTHVRINLTITSHSSRLLTALFGGKKTSSDNALHHFSSQADLPLGPQLSSGAAGVWSCSIALARAASFPPVYWNFPHPDASLCIIPLPAPITRLRVERPGI